MMVMMQRHETYTTLAISIAVGIAFLLVVRFFAGMSGDHEVMIEHLQNQSARLEDLEHNKARATARRFTADDYLALSQCLRIPYREREACLVEIEARINNR